MRPAFAIFTLAAGLGACGGNPYDCNQKYFREVDSDEIPRRMDFSAQDFADSFRKDWRLEVPWDQLPAGFLESQPPSFRSLRQGWTWTWEADFSLPVFHNALRKSPSRNCNLFMTGLPLGIDQLYIAGRVTAESDDGVWAFEGTQLLAAWTLPTDDNPAFVASATENLPEYHPEDSRMTRVHPELYDDVAAHLLEHSTLRGDADAVVAYLEGRLAIPNLNIEVSGGALDGYLVTGASFYFQLPE
jgi:hypothetical protein